MHILRNKAGRLLIPVLIMTLSIISYGEGFDEKIEKESINDLNFILTIKNNLISLDAKDASLKMIVEEIGWRMNIEVRALISEEDTITEKFNGLLLEEALQRISTNYVYLIESGKEKANITQIVLLPKGRGKPLASRAEGRTPKAKEDNIEASQKAEPFRFEFAPSELMKRE